MAAFLPGLRVALLADIAYVLHDTSENSPATSVIGLTSQSKMRAR